MSPRKKVKVTLFLTNRNSNDPQVLLAAIEAAFRPAELAIVDSREEESGQQVLNEQMETAINDATSAELDHVDKTSRSEGEHLDDIQITVQPRETVRARSQIRALLLDNAIVRFIAKTVSSEFLKELADGAMDWMQGPPKL